MPSGLDLSLASSSVTEGQGTTATVARTGDLSQPMTVQLSSSDTTEAAVPAYVVISSGQASASFNVMAVRDWTPDGAQAATITATAELATNVTADTSFGGNGSVQQGTITRDVALQPDGKIVTVGLRYNGGSSNFWDVAVSRYRADGTADTTFGGTGTVFTDVSGKSDKAAAVLVQPDGKILVGGTGGDGPHFFFVLARYNPDGSLDSKFGNGGKVITDPSPNGAYNEIWDLALQPDGRILAGGNISTGNDTVFAVARYHTNGSLDTSFGVNGVATTNPTAGTSDRAYSVLVQPDGRIVLVGGSAGGNSSSQFALSRFTAYGDVDWSFGGTGTVLTDVPGSFEQAFDAALQPDGKIVAVGQVDPAGVVPSIYNFALTRYNPDGSLDSSFGASGFVTTDFGGNDQAEGVALTPDGRIVVVGGGVTASNSTMRTVIAHYNADGTLGNSYSGMNTGVRGQGLALRADGRVVAVSGSNTTFAGYVERYTPVTVITDSATLTVEDDTNPSIQPDAYDAGEDETLTVLGFGVLANDYSPNGGLTASLVNGPAHGSLTLDAGGSFTYTPEPNYFGSDSFTYRATDPLGLSGEATVTLTVWGMDDRIQLSAPGAQTTAEDTPLTFSAANGNAITITDIENPRVLVALLATPGILTLQSTAGLEFPYPDSVNNSNSITFYADNPAEANAALEGLVYTPAANFNGPTYVSILVRDESYIYAGPPIEEYANVPINVTPVNDAPVAVADSYQAYEDETLTVYGFGVLGNDSDPEYDPLSAVLVSGPAHGTLTLNPGGSFTYTPEPNYYGPDSFTYRAADPARLSAEATVSLEVWRMDDAIQVTAPGPRTIAEDTSLTFSTANGTAVTITDIEQPRVLVVLLAQDGILSLASTVGLEFPDPASPNNSPHITFYADDPAEANAALDGLVFTPNPNFHGQVYFNVWVQDTTFVSFPMTASAYTNITVTAVNDAPVAVDDTYAVEAGVPFVTTPYYNPGWGNDPGVLANDQDAEWDLLSAVVVTGPAHGTLTFNPDGSFTYTAEDTYSGTDTFTYRASDGQLWSGLATATFTVTINQPPVSVGDAYAVDEDGSLSVPAPGVLGNDIDPEGQPLTAQLVSGPAHGALTLNPNGSFTYTPAANYHGPDEFWYRASDGTNLGDAVAVTLTVNAVNDAPVANNDSYGTNEDTALTVSAPGVLGNDTDLEGSALSAILVAGPAHGTLTLNSDGSFTYTPALNYSGPDLFTYKANEGGLNGNTATVNITVNAVNDAPVAVNDAYSVNEDQTLTIAPTPGITLLSMVSQPGDYIGQGLTYAFTPQTGTFMVNRNFDNGVSVFYSAVGQSWNLAFAAPFDANLTPGYYANATRWPFQATGVPGLSVSGNGRGSNTLTGSFTVTQALYAADGTVLRFAASFEQHSEGLAPALTGEIKFNQGDGPSGILLNDSDAEGSPLTIIVVSNPAHGSLAMNVDGSFKYTPHANYHGADSFSYKVSDGTNESDVATVSLTVNPVNDFPTANHDTYVVAEDNVLTVAAPGVLANDSDVDGDSLTASLVTSPTHGSLAFNADGSFTYTPHANTNGSDSFQYAARDGSSFSFIRTVTLIVTSVNDAPVANNDSYTTAEDTPLTVAASGVLGNDTDVEGTTLTTLLVSGPAHGTLTLNGNGSFTYTPDANYNGSDSFTYKASDGAAGGNVATVSLTISAVNDAPNAADDTYAVDEDQSLTIAGSGVLGNDGDVDGDSLSTVFVSGPAHGTLTLNGDGSFTYTPDANYHGGDSFTYKANDGSSDSNVATVTLTVNAVNDTPVAASNSYATNEDTALTVNAPGVLGNDSDVEGSALSAILVAGPAYGTLALNGDGSFSYTPMLNYNGTDSFTYKANDGGLDSNLATVLITVNAVNDAPVAADDGHGTNEDTPLTVNAPGVLGNDSDPDGDGLTAVLVAGPAHGTLTLNSVGSFTYTPAANYNGPDSFTYWTSDGSSDSNVATVSLTVNAVNDAPVAVAGPDRQNGEGGTATFDAAGSYDVDGDNLTYFWDFGDGNSAYGAMVQYAHADQGTYTVTLTVSDGTASGTDTMVMMVVNGAPLALLSGPATGVRGQPRTFTFAADDPSPVDDAAGFTFSITWGDGATQTVSGPSGQQVDHVFVNSGTYQVRVTATDKDGGVSSVAQQQIVISAVGMQDGNLVVGGTAGNDTINLKVANATGGVKVTIGGSVQGTFSPSGQILVYAQGGTDSVKFETTKLSGVTRHIQSLAVVHGDAGNDTLDARGSIANNVLAGDAGNDLIYGGLGRDILLGGLGADTLRGGQGEDLLVGNGTAHDGNLAALLALMAEWGRTDLDYATRAQHLQGTPGGLNSTVYLDPVTVADDAAIDQLYGESDLDLFFTTSSGANADRVNDGAGGEWIIPLS